MLSVVLGTSLFLQSLESVTGTVSYRERIALPATAVLHLRLDRIEGVNKTTVAESKSMLRGKQVPVDFRLGYFRTANDSNAKFGVYAKITDGDRVLFESSQLATLTGKPISVLLKMPQPSSVSQSPIQNIDWYLIEVNGKRPVPARQRPKIRFDSKTGSMGGHTGVNGFGGDYSISQDTIRIAPGPMTMMAGTPEQMDIESALTNMLPMVNRFRIDRGELQLLQDKKVLARFSPK